MRPFPLLVTLALIAPALLAGCLGAVENLTGASAEDALDAPAFDTSRGWSQPLSPAVHDVLPGVKAFVPSFDGTALAIGVFLPEIAGCDWNATTLPDACKLPVVMDAGPYYGTAVDQDKYRPPLVEWLVPRGYAVVQMSLRGTGESEGCYEFKSATDVDDVSAVIDHLVALPWSNGNVGMMGRSYDGTSAWAGAASGNPALKTIVPISGAVDAGYLYFKNGTSEARGPLGTWVYWPSYAAGVGNGGTPETLVMRACEAPVTDTADSVTGAVTGDASGDAWRERDLTTPILEKYNGSAWVIHGLEDWNVNPSQAVPFINELMDAGIETHAWLGQWAHAYPDRIDEHRNVRWDWAERVVQWFDHYLRGEGEKPTLGVEVEDSLYVWRHEARYPPADASFVEYELAFDGLAAPGEGATGSTPVASGQSFTMTSAPLEAPLRIAGLPQVHAQVTPTTTQGGYVFAELFDVFPDGRSVRIGWGAIDLRYHAGGNTEPATLQPGAPVTARMEFEPVDALVAEGHALRLVVHKDGVEDILPSPDPSPVLVSFGAQSSLLRLPVVERANVVPAYAAPASAE